MRCTQCASRMARCFQMKMQKRSYLLFFFFSIPFLHFAFPFSSSVKTIKIVVDDPRIRLFSNTHIRSTRVTKSDGALVPPPSKKKKNKENQKIISVFDLLDHTTSLCHGPAEPICETHSGQWERGGGGGTGSSRRRL